MTPSEQTAPPPDPSLIAATDAVRHETAAVAALADRLSHEFMAVVDEISTATGRVVVAGLGKSGLIGRKIAATLASTGTPATFVHAAEALHGDSGMVTGNDVLLVISASGETTEACQFARLVSARGVTVIAMVGVVDSTLGRCADHVLDVSVSREADPLNLAPTSSTTVTLVMGDALAAALMVRRGFTEQDFAGFHPGGSLGSRLIGRPADPADGAVQ
ncbi:MAG: KpsF/GutQ family sugar-phosphate isomerase [Micromonosporaceae bacterium]